MESETNFKTPTGCHEPGIVECSEIIDVRCNLKQFDGLIWLTLTPEILRQIYATEWVSRASGYDGFIISTRSLQTRRSSEWTQL